MRIIGSLLRFLSAPRLFADAPVVTPSEARLLAVAARARAVPGRRDPRVPADPWPFTGHRTMAEVIPNERRGLAQCPP